MATITTRYQQKIALEREPRSGDYVLTLQHTDGSILAQIGMEPHEYFELIDNVDERSNSLAPFLTAPNEGNTTNG